MTAYLANVGRPELDEMIRTAEHAERKAMVAFNMVPLSQPDSCQRLAAAAAVAQDCRAWGTDCYDYSFLLLAAEFDRVFDLGGDPPEYQPDEDSEQ